MGLILNPTHNVLNPNPFWTRPIPESESKILLDPESLDLFDQNGYHLTKIEQIFAIYNGYKGESRREEHVLRQTWFESNRPLVGPHLNHSDLFQRRGCNGDALVQLKEYAKKNPLLWKLIKMKPKWGIDLSIDYVDRDGNVFEVFHYEWDGFSYKDVAQKKMEIERFVDNQNWEVTASILLERKDEWAHLDFFEQSKWKTDLFNLSPEKFKNIIWETE
jgi:hypothetical protein